MRQTPPCAPACALARSERGQIAPWLILALAAATLAVVWVMALGQVYELKMATQDAADAGALATATWLARGLNALAWIQSVESVILASFVLAGIYLSAITSAVVVDGALLLGAYTSTYAAQDLPRVTLAEVEIYKKVRDMRDAALAVSAALSSARQDVVTSSTALAMAEADGASLGAVMGRLTGGEGVSLPTVAGLDHAAASLSLSGDRTLHLTLPVGPGEHREAWCRSLEAGALGGDDGGALEELLKAHTAPWPAIQAARQHQSAFQAERSGPGAAHPANVLWDPYLLHAVFKVKSPTLLAILGVGTLVTEVGEYADLPPLPMCDAVLALWAPELAAPWELEEGWRSELTLDLGVQVPSPLWVGGGALRSSWLTMAAHLRPGGRAGLIAVSHAEVYHPLYQDATPDLFSPQWRARLAPASLPDQGDEP